MHERTYVPYLIVALRFHAHWEHVSKMSEIRRALELMKRVNKIEDAPARRLALELGALACDRGSSAVAAARRAENRVEFASPDSPGLLLSGRESAVHGGGDRGSGGGGGGGVISCITGGKELGTGVDDNNSRLFDAPWQGAGEDV